MKPKNLLLLAAGATAAHGTASASAGATKSKPNILFILVDDLGWGDLSCQYAADLRTPNIDAIFETGVRCDNFYANSNVSSPSRAALMTGRFPAMVGVPGVIRTQPRQSWGYLSPSAVTMPQMLKRAGYQTALVGKWHLGLESPNLPNERGFDHFQGFLGDMMDDYNTHRREGHNYMFLNDREIDPEGQRRTSSRRGARNTSPGRPPTTPRSSSTWLSTPRTLRCNRPRNGSNGLPNGTPRCRRNAPSSSP